MSPYEVYQEVYQAVSMEKIAINITISNTERFDMQRMREARMDIPLQECICCCWLGIATIGEVSVWHPRD